MNGSYVTKRRLIVSSEMRGPTTSKTELLPAGFAGGIGVSLPAGGGGRGDFSSLEIWNYCFNFIMLF